MNARRDPQYAGGILRSRLIFASLGALFALASCDALFGFRDLDVDSIEADDGGGGDAGTTGEGAMSSEHGGGGVGGVGYGGFGAYGGFGGGFGGGYGGGFGGGCGTLDLGANCIDIFDCASCACEKGNDDGSPIQVCCEMTCDDCTDCDTDGFCTILIDQEQDPPGCMGSNFCMGGMCL